MPVGTNVRIAAPATGEPTAAAPGEASAIQELFGNVIANVGEPVSPAQMTEAAYPEQLLPSPAQLEVPAAQSADTGITDVVQQLIALAAGAADQETLEAAPALAPGDEPSAAAAPAEEQISVALEQLLAVVGRVATPSTRPSKLPITEENSNAATEEVATIDTPRSPDGAPFITALAIDPEAKQFSPAAAGAKNSTEAQVLAKMQGVAKAPLPMDEAGETQPAADAKGEAVPQGSVQLAKRTDTAVQQALSSLQAVVKELPPQMWAAALRHSADGGSDQDRPAPVQDLKLTALGTLPISPPLVQFEGVRPAENSQPLAAAAANVDHAELTLERQLDMTHEGEWLDQLARDIAQTAGSDKNPLRFRLNPETLGTLRVEITQDRNGAAVRFTADTEAARTIIADAQPRLIAEARAQGIRISETHVDLGNQTASGDPRRQNGVFEETPLRTARSLQDQVEGDGNPTPGRSERYA